MTLVRSTSIEPYHRKSLSRERKLPQVPQSCHPEESYDEVVNRLAEIAIDDEPLSEETLKRIEEALEDLRQDRYIH